MATTCHFCESRVVGENCGSCGRNQSARRRVCVHCQKMTPVDEAECSHCRRAYKSELRWKIPMIILLFVVAMGVSVAVRMAI